MSEAERIPSVEPPPPAAPPQPRHTIAWVVGAVVLLAVVVGVVARLVPKSDGDATAAGGKGGRGGAGGPVTVAVAKVETGDVPIVLKALGTVTPTATVTVRPLLAGRLTKVSFAEGQMVKKGTLLAETDPRPYQATLSQTEAALARDEAVLEGDKRDLERYQQLSSQNLIAKQQLDDQIALVRKDEGAVKSDHAQVDLAKLNVDYTQIAAPISGKVGLRQVDEGNFASPNDQNGIVVMTQLQPISVVFPVPEDDLPSVQKQMDAGAQLKVTALDRGDVDTIATGTLTAIDSVIDTSTGTVKMKAQFDNADGVLFPNEFVNVHLLVDELHDATVAPSAAIQHGSNGDFVYVVQSDDTVKAVDVKLGAATADKVSVQSGLSAGDVLVVDGADRLKDGAKIIVAGAKRAHTDGAPVDGTRVDGAGADGGPESHGPAAAGDVKPARDPSKWRGKKKSDG
jgi:multidrug efflux system membrane fusion protein